MSSERAIEKLVVKLFSLSWTDLHSSNAFIEEGLKFPGVYLLSCTDADLDGSPVAVDEVFYVGMSNSTGGVRQRLRQFRIGIEKNGLHSAAMRFYRDYCGGLPFAAAQIGKRIFFAALTLPCESSKSDAQAEDFRVMGLVACLEYFAVAHVKETMGRTPPLNKLGPNP